MALNAEFDDLSPGLRRFKVQGDAAVLATLDADSSPWPWTRNQWQQSLEFDECWLCSRRDQHMAAAVCAPVVDDVSLLNIIVAPQHRRNGLGKWLLQRLLGEYFSAGYERCLLEVRDGNVAARNLYRSLGFSVDGVRKEYYPAGELREDAVLMSLDLNTWFREAER